MPFHRKITRWFFDHLLWDPMGRTREGSQRVLWATRKVLIAVAAATLLTWREWQQHHPPEIVLIAFIHFAFVLAVIALLVSVGQWFRRNGNKTIGGQPGDTHD